MISNKTRSIQSKTKYTFISQKPQEHYIEATS